MIYPLSFDGNRKSCKYISLNGNSIRALTEYIYIYNFDALAQAQAIFESKGDRLSSCAECRIRTQGLRHQIASRLNARWQTDWAIESQTKNLNSTARLYDMISEHSAHSTPLPVGFRAWLRRYTCLLVLISMLWHRQAIFESKGDKLSSSAECRIRTQGLNHQIAFHVRTRQNWLGLRKRGLHNPRPLYLIGPLGHV